MMYRLKNRRVIISKKDDNYFIKFTKIGEHKEPPVECKHRKGKVWDTYITLSEEAVSCIVDYFLLHGKEEID